jgi:uncharacterized membrane protein (UPF0127 family)
MSRRLEALDDLVAPLATPRGQGWLRTAVWILLTLGAFGAVLVGADRPGDPHLLSRAALAATAAHSRPSKVAGFNQVGFRVVDAAQGGMGRAGCALLADTPARQEQGMMHRRDFGGYDAMLFRFPEDTRVPFYNKDVPIPLTVAWFDAAGAYIGQADLAVCKDPCPTFAPDQPYRFALEVNRGGLGRAGVGTHAVLLVGGACR